MDKKITISFYDNYLIEETDHIIKKIEYMKIKKIETENKFYIENKYETIIVQKEKCNEEEILLIKSILQKNKN